MVAELFLRLGGYMVAQFAIIDRLVITDFSLVHFDFELESLALLSDVLKGELPI